MNIAQIEENVKALIAGLASGACTQEDFIYELLLAYGHRKQSVSRLRSGERNLASKGSELNHNEIIWKRHLYFKQVEGGELLAEIDQMRKEKLVATNKIRFVIVTDFDQLFAHDLKTNDRLDISLDELPNKFDFFLPWAGMEKAVYQGENPADVKAAEKMAKLFDLIKGDNFDESNKDDTEALHGLNVFLTRLLFCFFAEDTEIFADNQFSNAIQSHTKDDGSDLADYLNRLFTVLNTAGSDRGELPEYLSNFPYVNGGLFATDIPSPSFTAKSRRMLIECGSELDWSDINPDIFGSMIQAVVHPDQRGGMGMHYTSVTNIMKVIEPLFLNDLYEELETVEESDHRQKFSRLQKLQQRLGEIKIFDPACGSGNFLIIAYKELRKLEMEVLKRLQEFELEKTGQISQPFSVIKLSQFYGIELDDFAHEVAILSLWLTEHQMNVEFKSEFGETLPSLPLQKGGNVICENALRINWDEIGIDDSDEVYICGNPPYVGTKYQSAEQKQDLYICLNNATKSKDMDYIVCWFIKASKFINGNRRFAFVSTNSISQGIQVSTVWPLILNANKEIFFALKEFKWTNSARNNAGVTCSIIGVRCKSNKLKYLYVNDRRLIASNISPYLIDSSDTVVKTRKKLLSLLPKMKTGNSPREGGHLIFSQDEKNSFVKQYPTSEVFFKKLLGSSEFIKGTYRWCLWIEDQYIEQANNIQGIKSRVDSVRIWRENSVGAAFGCKDRPHQFQLTNRAISSQIVIPSVSSERRNYIPIGFMDRNTILTNQVMVLYDPESFVFSLLTSRMHMTWVRAVAGKLESRFRYTPGLCYNSFPFPTIDDKLKEEVTEKAFLILKVREKYSDKTLADLYDPDKMPEDLLLAHKENDRIIDKIYSKNGFSNDEERLKCLFSLYSKMEALENA